MKFLEKDPPRAFLVGTRGIELRDCGGLSLAPNEQVSFLTDECGEYDVVRKNWGFYATPSLNGRLVQEGFHSYLVRSQKTGRIFVTLVEEKKVAEFHEYLKLEELQCVQALHSSSTNLVCICGSLNFEPVFEYHSPPKGEINFKTLENTLYQRTVVKCTTCGHFLSFHAMNLSTLYGADYVNATYGEGLAGIKKTFQRIMALPPEKSDNVGRAKYVNDFWNRFNPRDERRLLDIGSGLGVFIAAMQKLGWVGFGVDKDPRQLEHLKVEVLADGYCGDIATMPKRSDLPHFSLISLNKVLEHVENPIQLLKESSKWLSPQGFIYIELPDGEMACTDGPEREEFFIEHPHIFSMTSAALLVQKAGLKLIEMSRLQEPSTKYTIRIFARI